VAPDYELGALRVLMKPHDWTRGAIEHRAPLQVLPAGAGAVVTHVRDAVARRLGVEPPVYFPEAGDFLFVAEFSESETDAARALAVALSRKLAGVWLTVDRLFVRDGRFFRRERGFKLNLVEATNVHLKRDVRARLKDLV
jgi:hypothetical protein